MQRLRQLRGLWVWLALLCVPPLSRVAHALDLVADVAESEARLECRDDRSAQILALWLDSLPLESRVLLEDPVVRKASTRSAASVDKDVLRAAGKRIYVAQAAKQGLVDRAATLRRVNELQREFKSGSFPMSLEQALRADTPEARLYVEAAASAIRPLPDLRPSDPRAANLPRMRQRDTARQPVFSACGDMFRSYLISIDERIAFIPTKIVQNGGSDPVLQQLYPGTDTIAYRTPTSGCQRTPAGSAFFVRQPNGRLAGNYSSLGFPEVVQISFSTPSNHRWGCSGVLLAEKWALTAAHCTDDDGAATGQSVAVRVMLNAGVARLRNAKGLPHQSTAVGDPIIHESYLDALSKQLPASKRGPSDLALFELATPLDAGAAVSVDSANAPDGMLGTLAGYGATLGRQAADVANAPLDVGWLRLAVTPSTITWEPEGDQSPSSNASCPGDSGAPIFMSLADKKPASDEPAIGCIGEKRELIGLVSYGQSLDGRSCVRGSSGAGPRLYPHIAWICQKTGLMCK